MLSLAQQVLALAGVRAQLALPIAQVFQDQPEVCLVRRRAAEYAAMTVLGS